MNAALAPLLTSAMELAWRPMRDGDLAMVAALEAESHLAPWTIGNFRDALAAGYGTLIVESAGAIIAYGVLMLAPGEAQLLNLTVRSAMRRHGLGRELLRRFLRAARELGAEQCFLEVRQSNAAAIGLYSAEGFAAIARRDGYYPPAMAGDGREDALVLRRALTER
ncbi:MAG: ribosomal protein S18-alanine N-acetyltransferase [Casimicrobiaceae bacterium]